MLALSESGLTNPDLYCEVDGKIVESYVNPGVGHELCDWKTYFIDCPVERRPNNVALLGDHSIKHEVISVLKNTRYFFPISHHLIAPLLPIFSVISKLGVPRIF
jgi:hypothetical protein